MSIQGRRHDDLKAPLMRSGEVAPYADESQSEQALDYVTMESNAIREAELEDEEKRAQFTWDSVKQELRANVPYFIAAAIMIILLACAGVFLWDMGESAPQAWITIAVVCGTLLLLFKDIAPPHIVMVFAMTVLLATQVITTPQALSGFANEGVISIGVLFVVAKAMEVNNSLEGLAKYVLRTPTRLWQAQLRMMMPVALLSAFMNNTPLVAMMIPLVADWSRRIKLSASKLMIPLSYAAVLGGTCTLIGTSTNLIVAALAEAENPDIGLGFFEIGYIGFPNLIVCVIYIVLASPYLLPDSQSTMDQYLENPRDFTAAVRVATPSPIDGKTIESAGLRGLPGVFLFQVERGGETISAPGSDYVLRSGDLLFFSGLVSTMPDVFAIEGVEPESKQLEKISGRLRNRRLVEIVIANKSPLTGRTVRETRFRSRYNAAIIAIHRRGQRIEQPIGNIELEAGDTLLVEASSHFLKYHMLDQDFALVTPLLAKSVFKKQRVWKTALTLLVTLAFVVVNTVGVADLVTCALVAACLLLLARCVKPRQATEAVQGELLVLIAAAFSLGQAMQTTGAAKEIADSLLVVLEPLGAVGILGGVYLITSLLTEVISNAATVTLMFPIAWSMAVSAGIGEKSVVYVLMMAGSSSFCTPIGYQTNLMVMTPGGYKFGDYLKFGLPLNVVSMIVSVGLSILLFA